MFRKTAFKTIRPNLLTELRKEFSGIGRSLIIKTKVVFRKKPKLIFCLMVILMLLSLSLCFCLRRPVKPIAKPVSVIRPLSGSLGKIGSSFSDIQRMMLLRERLDSLLKKEHLSRSDSIAFAQILTELSVHHKPQ